MLDEIPYGIFGPDMSLHYRRNLGDPTIAEASECRGYFIVHDGPHCKQRRIIDRHETEIGESIGYCLLERSQ